MTLTSELKVAMVLGNGVSQETVTVLRAFLERQGVQVDILSTHLPEVKAVKNSGWGIRIRVDKLLVDSSPEDYDAILVPDGIQHADELCQEPCAKEFISSGYAAGKPVAGIGHGVRILMETKITSGRTVAASEPIRVNHPETNIQWSEQTIASDNGLITCVGDECLNEFTKEFLEQLRAGIQQRSETII